METITLHTRGINVALAVRPVTCQEFKAYLAVSGRPTASPLAHGDSGTSPVTEVSQVEAADYCRSFGAQQGRSYRLPSMAELHELADEITQEGINPEVWPHTHQLHPEVRGGMKPTYLCEWTQEVEELQPLGGNASVRRLGSVSIRRGCVATTPRMPKPIWQPPRATRSSRFGSRVPCRGCDL